MGGHHTEHVHKMFCPCRDILDLGGEKSMNVKSCAKNIKANNASPLFFQRNCTKEPYQEKEVQETSSARDGHMGAVLFSHGYCKSFPSQHSAQSGICWSRKVVGHPSEVLHAGLHENKRTDLMVQDEAAVNCRLYHAR
jgi:hypothetical protein